MSFECNSLPHVDENNIFHCHIVLKHDDVRKAISNLKSKINNEQGTFFSNNFLYGTDLLHCHLSILFLSMINHGYAPPRFLHSSMIPLPKGTRADLSKSDMYRNFAKSSLLLSTSNYQFGFKEQSSTVLCTTMVNKTIQNYFENGNQAVYLLLLDASKALDKVSYE